MRHPEEVERRPDRIPDVRYPGGMSAEKNSGWEIPGWNVSGEEFRIGDTRVECQRGRIPDGRYLGGMSVEKNSGWEIPGWNVDGKEFRMGDTRVECRRGRIPDGRCPSGMSDATCRKGEGATRQFLGRIPQDQSLDL